MSRGVRLVELGTAEPISRMFHKRFFWACTSKKRGDASRVRRHRVFIKHLRCLGRSSSRGGSRIGSDWTRAYSTSSVAERFRHDVERSSRRLDGGSRRRRYGGHWSLHVTAPFLQPAGASGTGKTSPSIAGTAVNCIPTEIASHGASGVLLSSLWLLAMSSAWQTTALTTW